MDAVSFWDMTYAEINASIKAYGKQRETDMRIQSIIAYHQANQISLLVGRLVGNKNDVPAIHEAYPSIFPEMERKAEEQKQQQSKQQNWQIMKARVEAYAANAAEKRKRGERRGDNT